MSFCTMASAERAWDGESTLARLALVRAATRTKRTESSQGGEFIFPFFLVRDAREPSLEKAPGQIPTADAECQRQAKEQGPNNQAKCNQNGAFSETEFLECH